MTFRNPELPPYAFLPQPGGFALTCTLLSARGHELIIGLHGPVRFRWRTNDLVALALDPEATHPERCVQSSVLRCGEASGRLQLALPDAQGFWAAARASDAYNRRRSFRVSTIDQLPLNKQDLDHGLQIEIQHGLGRVRAEMLDLSVSGCGLRIHRQDFEQSPDPGSRVMIQVSGGDLEDPLRVPAEVQRKSARSAHLLIGFHFLQGDNRSWKQVEQQIGRYLTAHQQRLIGDRAA